MKEYDINLLTDEGMKLLRMEIDELYATLGGQLLARNLPSRTAGIVSYLSAARSAAGAKTLYEALPMEPSLIQWAGGLGVIYEELKRDGLDFIGKVKQDLRTSLWNEDLLQLTEQINRSTMQVIIMLVGGVFRMPREFEPISVTVAVILLKQGLRNFFREDDDAKPAPFLGAAEK